MTRGIVTPLGTMLGPDIWGPPSYEWARTVRCPDLAPVHEDETRGRGREEQDLQSQGSSEGSAYNGAYSYSGSSASSYYETASYTSGSVSGDEVEEYEEASAAAPCMHAHQHPHDHHGHGRHGHQNHKHGKECGTRGQATLEELDTSEKWTCPSCGNENYKWRFVCNIRRCRQLKPKELLDCKLPKDAWVCFACGNLNFGHRRSCNMRNCRAPRDQVHM
ncbi:RanBP2-type zinc finger protein At1g67325 [Hondaea fermentalgiana]|uniref:RanBP2-type zinc finger protein At1g67325 n=1 Tax=Hondaea fermentalgiana TaxID=2315210 RepID=A0A2R5GVY3_9STRA|nr:RanBP2-type zinc finger protein At1g67325 [Hondaea fermentalgiana]|eukprot:GBG35000.1 RanBP2-type zinc finger protein At1g67325 [Hondaea fermentalgiana]